jgi:hypothetical protein
MFAAAAIFLVWRVSCSKAFDLRQTSQSSFADFTDPGDIWRGDLSLSLTTWFSPA